MAFTPPGLGASGQSPGSLSVTVLLALSSCLKVSSISLPIADTVKLPPSFTDWLVSFYRPVAVSKLRVPSY